MRPDDIFDALDEPMLVLAAAMRDGRIDEPELQLLLRVLLDEAREAAGRAIPDLADLVGDLCDFAVDLLRRDRAELLAAAERQEAKGRHKRARKLRERAERRS